MGFLDFLPLIGKVVDRILPDPAQKAAAQLQLAELAQKGDLAELEADVTLATAQTDINKIEAASSSFFTAGWRPAVGWVGAISLGLAYIPKELVLTTLWGMAAYHTISSGTPLPSFPDLGITDLLGLLGSLLGFGFLRSQDKKNGVA